MYRISIYGKVSPQELKREVKRDYESFWKPVFILIKDKVLTYSEAMSIDFEEMERLLLVNNLYNQELERITKRKNK